MAEQSTRITKHYRGMLDCCRQPRDPKAHSETEGQIGEMDPGARSSLEFAQRAYQGGGNEGESYAEKAREERPKDKK